jgi:hypothetical protein
MEQYTIKLVTEADIEIDFDKLHDLVYESIVSTLPSIEVANWDKFDWITNLGDDLSENAEHYLEKILGYQLDVEANDLVIDDITSDFYRFLDNLYC